MFFLRTDGHDMPNNRYLLRDAPKNKISLVLFSTDNIVSVVVLKIMGRTCNTDSVNKEYVHFGWITSQ